MHLHGQDMTIVSLGNGQWDGKDVFRPTNPVRRDVIEMSAFSHLVIQFEANNPGVWPFHCHIAWHLSMVHIPFPLHGTLALYSVAFWPNLLASAPRLLISLCISTLFEHHVVSN
jgi:hypothetical protein